MACYLWVMNWLFFLNGICFQFDENAFDFSLWIYRKILTKSNNNEMLQRTSSIIMEFCNNKIEFLWIKFCALLLFYPLVIKIAFVPLIWIDWLINAKMNFTAPNKKPKNWAQRIFINYFWKKIYLVVCGVDINAVMWYIFGVVFASTHVM